MDIITLSDARPIGYHSTSIDVVKILIENKSIPSDDDRTPRSHPPGHFYFTPVKERFKRTRLYKKLLTSDHLTGMKSYAELHAFSHHLFNTLGFVPRADLGTLSNPHDIGHPAYAAELRKLLYEAWRREIPETIVTRHLFDAYHRKGVHIGLSRAILRLPIKNDPEAPGESLRIPCDELPLKYICGVVLADPKAPDARELERYLQRR